MLNHYTTLKCTCNSCFRTLNDAVSAVEAHTVACDSISDVTARMSDRISKLQCLPLGHQAMESSANDVRSLKADHTKLSGLLRNADDSVAMLESVCGSKATLRQKNKCDG